ncbi:hypothetical protein PUN28_016154 [Cardiocondyla obscurior]|uniref:Uncharacterized protein n=1 Tax=Cardiocondyla obscurior TaxID=286306 RepID=A0AAW2ETL7_9HYME
MVQMERIRAVGSRKKFPPHTFAYSIKYICITKLIYLKRNFLAGAINAPLLAVVNFSYAYVDAMD